MEYYAKAGYELVDFSSKNFPMILHRDALGQNLSVDSHWHPEIEILHIIKGSMLFISNQTSHTAGVGDTVFINPYCIHKLVNTTPVCVYYCMQVPTELFQGIVIPSTPSISNDPQLSAITETIIDEFYAKKPYYETYILGQLISLVVSFKRIIEVQNERPQNSSTQVEKIYQAINYIHQHFDEEIPIQDICNVVGFSKPYLSKLFREVTGKTIIDYLNTFRCDHVHHLLLTGKYSIQECAEMSGFHNMSYFTRKYREQFGILPSQTKRQVAANQTDSTEK